MLNISFDHRTSWLLIEEAVYTLNELQLPSCDNRTELVRSLTSMMVLTRQTDGEVQLTLKI